MVKKLYCESTKNKQFQIKSQFIAEIDMESSNQFLLFRVL